MTSTLTLLRAMWISFRRDRAALFFTTVFPLLFLVVLANLRLRQRRPNGDGS